MIPIVPAPDDWSIGRWVAPAQAISGTGETATELMLPRRDQRSDVEGGEHLDQSARKWRTTDAVRKLSPPARRLWNDYCAYSLSPAGSPVAAAVLRVAGIRYLA